MSALRMLYSAPSTSATSLASSVGNRCRNDSRPAGNGACAPRSHSNHHKRIRHGIVTRVQRDPDSNIGLSRLMHCTNLQRFRCRGARECVCATGGLRGTGRDLERLLCCGVREFDIKGVQEDALQPVHVVVTLVILLRAVELVTQDRPRMLNTRGVRE